MANVQLPNINITPSDIDSASLPSLQKIVKGLLNTMAIMTEELTYLLNNLDTRNVNEIDGDVLVSGTVTAAKMMVEELSAISANLGHITAGLIEAVDIFGSYIATRKDAYPRSELNNVDDLFGAFKNASNAIKVQADYYGVPAINVVYGGNVIGRVHAVSGAFELTSIGHMILSVNGGNLIVPKFTDIESYNGYNLGFELDDKAKAGISTNPSGSHNHGIPDGTVLLTPTGTVTFYSAPQHTHEQTN